MARWGPDIPLKPGAVSGYGLACTRDLRAVETLEQALAQVCSAEPDEGEFL